MVRPKRSRCITGIPASVYFKPRGIPMKFLKEVTLTLDEAEALRLADLEGKYHEDAGEVMGVSRATFGRILTSARKKIAEAIFSGMALKIEGGSIVIPENSFHFCPKCMNKWKPKKKAENCPECGNEEILMPEKKDCPSGKRRGKGNCGKEKSQEKKK